jgi:5-methylcytosine-specific restriction endonuclease McrBC regulatory subunit McrC
LTMTTELLNTQSILFGQVSKFVEICESRLSEPIELSEVQLSEIKKIGRDLASKKTFYGLDEDDELDSDGKGSAEIIKSIPTQSGLHRIRVHNAIGSISLTDLTIHVLPKISLNHFVHLASRTFEDPRSHKNPVKVSSLNALRNVLASWCITSIERLTKGGLVSEYQDCEEQLQFIRGRVNTKSTATNFLRGRLLVDCRFDELNIDNPLNRILKSALFLISMERDSFSSDLRARAFDLHQHLPLVSKVLNSDFKIRLGRHSNHYGNALDLSLRIIAGSALDIRSGKIGGQTFLIPTPGLIEAAIRVILETQLAPIQVKKAGKVVSQHSYFSINPDLVFDNGSVTGDVKYKIATQNWVRSDVAQAAMFASGFNAKAAVIVTFSNTGVDTDLEMNLGDLPLHRITWRSGEEIDPIVAEEEFIARMRAFLLPFQLAP